MTLRATITPMRRAARVTAKPIPPAAEVELDYSNDFPFCCGIKVLGEATVTDANGREVPPESAYKDVFASALLEAESDGGLMVYTTISSQTVEKAALRAAGYSVLATFLNPSSGNWCQLHAKLINQPRTRAAARRRGVRRASRR